MGKSTRRMRVAGTISVALVLGGAILRLRTPSPAAAAETPPPVLFFDHGKVNESFRNGGILFKDPKRNYQVHTSHREGPGEAELHTRDTDIFYIQQGTATFVTGGKMIDPQNTAPDEVRGKGIEGGEARHLVKGDVIIIPNGTPHWFREVSGPFTYFTVKSR